MAIDDAYSKYVMTLKPQSYLRFRDVATGHVVALDEVRAGPGVGANATYPSRGVYNKTLTASNVGSGVFLPGLTSSAFLQFRNDLRVVMSTTTPGASTTLSEVLTDNSWAPINRRVNPQSLTVNYWYRVPSSQGAVNDRLFAISSYDLNNATATRSLTGVHMFSWNSGADNGLVEMCFRKPSGLIGTGYLLNMGNNETYRYLSNQTNNTVNTIHMATLVLEFDRAKLYRDGVIQQEFTWNPDDYRLLTLAPTNWGLGCGAWSDADNSGLNDYATADVAEFSLHTKSLSSVEIAELYKLGTTGTHTRAITGSVVDGAGNPLARTVRAHYQKNGAVVGEAVSNASGAFSIPVPASAVDPIYLLAFDDLGTAPDYNAAIQSGVVAV